MPIPIGLSGLKGSGKDAAFGFIRNWAAERDVLARRRSFADALKLSFARIFLPDCSVDEAVNWCNEIKFVGHLAITWGDDNPGGTSTEITHHVSGRVALQRYGTEGHRDVFGDNFWVDILFPLATIDVPHGAGAWGEHDPMQPEAQYPRNFMGPLDQQPPEICVAADERFDNEAQRIIELQGYNIRIVRPDLEDDGDSHVSEAGVSDVLITSTIVNDGDLDDFEAKIVAWCEEFLVPSLSA